MALLSGCKSPSAVESLVVESRVPSLPHAPTISEGPRDGKILVVISGNAKEQGKFWVCQDASLETIEIRFALQPEFASHRVGIFRRDAEGWLRMRCRIDKMTRAEKENIKVIHGDLIEFDWDRCFGFVPNAR